MYQEPKHEKSHVFTAIIVVVVIMIIITVIVFMLLPKKDVDDLEKISEDVDKDVESDVEQVEDDIDDDVKSVEQDFDYTTHKILAVNATINKEKIHISQRVDKDINKKVHHISTEISQSKSINLYVNLKFKVITAKNTYEGKVHPSEKTIYLFEDKIGTSSNTSKVTFENDTQTNVIFKLSNGHFIVNKNSSIDKYLKIGEKVQAVNINNSNVIDEILVRKLVKKITLKNNKLILS